MRPVCRGLRRASLSVQAGAVFTVPRLADLSASVGTQVSGNETGNPPVEVYVKGHAGTTLGLSVGKFVGTHHQGVSSGAGFLNFSYQQGDPISGKSFTVRWPGLGSVSLNQRGFGVSAHLPIGFEFAGGFRLGAGVAFDVEHPALEPINEPVFDGIDYAIQRAKQDIEIVKKNLPGFMTRHFEFKPEEVHALQEA